jgi:hypothetical protein
MITVTFKLRNDERMRRLLFLTAREFPDYVVNMHQIKVGRPTKESDKAMEFLEDLLSAGGQSSLWVQSEAKKAGISDKTLHRVKKYLGVSSRKVREKGKTKWYWWLPDMG